MAISLVTVSNNFATKDIRTVKPDFYAVPPQNIFEISPDFQLAMYVDLSRGLSWLLSSTESAT